MAQVPAVAPALPPVGALPAIVAPTTYRELMSDATRDAVAANPGAYLAGYRFVDAGGGGIPVPATLRDQTILLCDRQPMAFMCLVPRPDGIPKVRILHRFMRYLDLPGEQPTGFHDRVLALLGDVRPNQYPVVDIPNTAFHLAGVGGVRVPTAAAMDGIIAEWVVDNQNLGPYPEADATTAIVRPRHIQLLPTRYAAALLVHRDGLSPKAAYTELAGAIHADGNEVACADVLTWLRTAFTARGGGGPQPDDSILLHAFPAVHLPLLVYTYVSAKVAADLPALRPRDAVGDAGLQAQLALLAAARGPTAPSDGDRGERGPKTVHEAYKETFPLLLRFNQVDQVEEVAPIWARLANSHKSEHQAIMQQEFAKVCTARGLAPELHCPVVTTKLKQMVLSFNFAGTGPDDLASGMSPFLVTYAGAKDYYQAQEVASVTHQLDQGTQNASLADIQAIKVSEKVRFPSDLHQTSITLQRFAVLAQALLQSSSGELHPFVRNVLTFANGFLNRLPFIMDRFHGLVGNPAQQHYPARILQTVQVLTYEYMQSITAAVVGFDVVDAAPDFNSLLTDLQRGTHQTSSAWIALPSEYLEALPSPLQLLQVVRGPTTRGTEPSTAASVAAASVVSGLTTAAPASTRAATQS